MELKLPNSIGGKRDLILATRQVEQILNDRLQDDVRAKFGAKKIGTKAGQQMLTQILETNKLKDDTATLILKVPHGKRFVLTDVWLLSMEDDHTPADIRDRVWMENRRDGDSFIVFDSKVAELSLPLRWQTGVSYEEDTEMWMLWDFDTGRRRLRRIHYTGYWEELDAPVVAR